MHFNIIKFHLPTDIVLQLIDIKVYIQPFRHYSCVFVASLCTRFGLLHTSTSQCKYNNNSIESQFYDCTLRFVSSVIAVCSNVFAFHSLMLFFVLLYFFLFILANKKKQFYDRFFYETCYFFSIYLSDWKC